MNMNNELLFEPEVYSVEDVTVSPNGLLLIESKNGMYYVNQKGDEVIPCKFDWAVSFSSNGFANVEVDGKSGVINTTGEFVIPCEYSELIMFEEEGLVFVKK